MRTSDRSTPVASLTRGIAGRSATVRGTTASNRLLSEVAHDLRSPLTTVRETIRLVANGDLGAVNDHQQQYLVDAMDVCDSMERLVTDMLQLERLQTGRVRALRSWFDLEPILYRVSATLDALLRQRKVAVSWDGVHPGLPPVFGDADMVHRILCNLVSNAVRETAENQHVLIRVRQVNDDQTLKIFVIDNGRGMDIASWNVSVRRGVSGNGGEGIGLSICRQLATAHYTPLSILSRIGQGTEISFELPLGGGPAVATQWAQWREQQQFLHAPRRRNRLSNEPTTKGSLNRMFLLPESQLLLLQHDGPPALHASFAALVHVSAGATVPMRVVDAFDQRLQRDQQTHDLVYRVSPRRWVVVWDANLEEARDRIIDLEANEGQTADSNARLTWSVPRLLKLQHGGVAIQLADAFARATLEDRESISVMADDMPSESGSDWTASPVPFDRLRAELSHLSKRVQRQSKQIRKQAQRARLES